MLDPVGSVIHVVSKNKNKNKNGTYVDIVSRSNFIYCGERLSSPNGLRVDLVQLSLTRTIWDFQDHSSGSSVNLVC